MYLIPRNVRQHFEFFPGFGWRELFLTLIGFAAGLFLFFLFGLFTQSLGRAFLIVFTTAAAFFIGKGDSQTGRSILSLFNDYKVWRTKQQRYLYYFGTGGKE